MRLLITGVSGFVGKNLVNALIEDGGDYTAYGLDKMAGTDLAQEDVALRWMQEHPVDLVVHLAASCSTPGSLDDPLQTFKDTVRTGVNVLEGCRRTGTPIIVTSSVKARDGMTPYGKSKQMVEMWAEEYMESYGLPIIINRPGTIYGPGQEGSPESGWIAWFLRAKEMGLKVTINGDGSQVRDLLYVEDYCRLLIRQITEFGTYAGQTWDIGGGRRNAVSVKEMAEYLKLDYEFGPPRTGDASTYIGENVCPTWEPQTHWREKL